MPEHKKNYSLITRFRISMGIILLLVFVSMLSSIQVTESVSGMGSAVNDAGSLRMLAYQIGTTLQAQSDPERKASTLRHLSTQFSNRLNGPVVRRPLQENGNARLQKTYENVVIDWRRIDTLIQKSIASYQSNASNLTLIQELQSEYLYALPAFVSVM